MGHAAPETEGAFQTGLDIPIYTQDEPAAGDVSTDSQAARAGHVDKAERGSTIELGQEEAVGESPQQERERSAEMAKESAKEEARKATDEVKEHAASGWDAARRGVAETTESIKQPAARESSEDVSRKASEGTAASAERAAPVESQKAAEGAAVAERKAEDARAGAAAGIEETKEKAVQAREEAGKQAEESAQGVKEIAQEAQAEAQAAGEKVQGSFDSMAERARGVMERTLESIQETVEAARERSAQAGETAEQAGETAKEAGREAYEKGKGFAAETKDAAVENLEAAGTVTARGLGKAVGTVEGAAEAVGESAQKGVSAAAERTAEGIESAQEGARGAYDRTAENVSASAAGARDRTAETIESAQEGIASAEEGAKDAYNRRAENISASAAGARDTGAVATGTVAGAVGQIFHSFAEALGVAGKHAPPEAPVGEVPSAEASAAHRPLSADVKSGGERSVPHAPDRAPASLSARTSAEGGGQHAGGSGAGGGGEAGEAERHAGKASFGEEEGAIEPGLGGGVRYHPEPSADLGGSGLSAMFAAGSKADVPQNYPHASQETGEQASKRTADVGGGGESGSRGAAEESGPGHGGGDGTAATETAAGRSAVKSPSSDERGVFGGGGVPGAKSVPWDQVNVGEGVDEKGVDRRQQVEMLKGGARELLGRITKAVMDKSGIETVEPKNRIAKENTMAPKIAGQREELGIGGVAGEGGKGGGEEGEGMAGGEGGRGGEGGEGGGGWVSDLVNRAHMGDLVEQAKVRRQSVKHAGVLESVATAAEHVKDAMVGRRAVGGGEGDVESAKMADSELGRLVKEAQLKEQ
ncbi:unnamed protein product [Closterium sp. NIES-64]|nr:unnamed protein product [Closterium sp. NIES-64]